MNKFKLDPDKKYGYLKVSPTPTLEEISKYYADEFYSSDYKKLNDSSIEVQDRDREFYDSRWEDISDSIDNFFRLDGNFSSLNLLDIGCGWGAALLYFRNKGINCYGFDPVPEAIKYAQDNNLNCIVSSMDRLDVFSEIRFDVVTLINVLEHLGDPDHVLTEIRDQILRPGGLLIIDVPNEFNVFQTAGRELHGLDEWWVCPPAHLNYFNATTLTNLLTGIGFEIVNVESSFPLEMFLLFGDDYVSDSNLGRECHLKRVNFELNLRKSGQTEKLRNFYRSLAKLDLGRQIVAYAKN